MTRFFDCDLIERERRHDIRLIDLDVLRKKSPPASLPSAVFEKWTCRQGISFGRYAERSALILSGHENQGVIPPVVTTGPLSRSSAEHAYASRSGW